MKLHTFLFFSILVTMSSLTNAAERLIATPERVEQARAAILARHPHHLAAFTLLQERIQAGDLREAYGNASPRYVDGYQAREAALAALLTPNIAQRQEFADLAFDAALKAANRNDAPLSGMQSNPNELGLKSAMNGMSVALTYNWVGQAWTPEQQQQIRDRIVAGLEDWPKFRHANTSQSHDGSNWVAVTRGAEYIMIHAIGEQNKRAGRVRTLENHLINHMKNAFGDQGVGQEGLGYTEYPGVFLLPAALVNREMGSGAVWREVENHAWWKLAMYTHSFQPRAFDKQDRKFLTWGVAERGHDQGWASLLLATVPEAQLPYYLWFYDRHLGKEFAGPMPGFDRHRAGTVWSLLLYPPQATPRDPTGVFPPMVADSNGFAFFRNRWQDQDDIQLAVGGDEDHHSNAWDQPDAFSLALLAQNNAFITGAGKSTSESSQTGLLVDGKKRSGSNTRTGKMLYAEPSPEGGNARVDGGGTYKHLGMTKAERDVAVLFTPPTTNTAVISVWDRLESGGEKTYTWQLNTGAPQSKGDLDLKEGVDQGRKTFTLTGKDGGTLKGWVMYPADVEILTGADPLQIRTGTAVDGIWVVLHTGKGAPPPARMVGEGLQSGIEINRTQIFLNGSEDKAVLRTP